MASTARLTSTGMEILNSDDNVIAAYSADAVIGRTDAGQSNVLIDSDGSIDIRRGTEVSASFGTTTTIGPTSGNHVEITSTSLAIKTSSNVTALSASAAGLEMSGKVKATSGEIGGFLISENEISSSLTPKRGLVLKPGDSIRGYGNTVHSTTTVAGKFRFGVATISPAADAEVPFSPESAGTGGGPSL